MIYLREISSENFYDVIRLKVSENQTYSVASNTFSIAQSRVQPECKPFVIYKNELAVGFVMYSLDPIDNEFWIYRLMVDERFQKQGYGRKALELAVARIKEERTHKGVYISFEIGNEEARRTVEKLGFIADGRTLEEEIVYKLDF